MTYYVITDNNTQCYFNLQSLVIIDFALHNFYLLINYYRMLKNIDDYGMCLVKDVPVSEDSVRKVE